MEASLNAPVVPHHLRPVKSKRASIAAVASVVALVLCGATSVASAAAQPGSVQPRTLPPCTDSWLGGSGLWSSSNWSSGTPDSMNDGVVCITVPGSSVTVGGLPDVGALIVGATSGAPSTYTIQSTSGVETEVELSADSFVQPTGVISLTAGATNASYTSTLITLDGATITNDGLIETSGIAEQLYTGLTNDADGTVMLNATQSETADYPVVNDGAIDVGTGTTYVLDGTALTLAAGTFKNQGTVTAASTGTLHMAGGVESGNALDLAGFEGLTDSGGTGSLVLSGENTIAGTIPTGQRITLLSTASVETQTNLVTPVANHGSVILDVSSAGSANGLGGDAFDNYGVFNVQSVGAGGDVGAVVTNEPSGRMSVSGFGFVSTVKLVNDGTLDLARGTHLQLSNGDATEGAKATLGVTVASGAVSQITSSSGASVVLAGRLWVTTIGSVHKGVKVQPIDVTASSVTGHFVHVSSPNAVYSVTYAPTSVTLTAGTPFTAKAKPIKGVAGAKLTATVATLAGVPAKTAVAATISWGDGSKLSPGKVTLRKGTGTVVGVHRFAHKGTFTVTITVTDSDGTIRTLTTRAAVS